MSDFELSDFEIVSELPGREHRKLFRAVLRRDGTPVQLTVFSSEISQQPEFRRAVKTDRAMLSMLQHQSILPYVGSGESGGQLFLCSEACEYDSLAERIAQRRSFSPEDVIEIGWQLCSALQQAHNRGLAHGGLSLDSVLLSDNLQVTLIDFGVDRWLKAAQNSDPSAASGPALITISALASREEVENDLADLATILVQLRQTTPENSEQPEAGRGSIRGALDRLLARITSSNPTLKPVSARELQGRLGEILIGNEDDAMPLVDHRESMGSFRRSIIKELFDPPAVPHRSGDVGNQPAGSAFRSRILPVLIGILIIAFIIMLAELLR